MGILLQHEVPSPTAPLPDSSELLQAFSFFTKAAGTLEHSYLQLSTEVCRLRKELEAANQDLQRERERYRRSHALAEVSTLLAHEIRNPLGSLELFASLLADSGLKGAQERWLHQIQAGLRTLSATVNNVLHLHSEAMPELISSDMGELLHWTVEFLTPLAEQNGMNLELDNDLRGIFMPADVHRLRQVLLNLALNAFRHMTEGGKLRIVGSRARKGGQLRIQISDEGIGIAPEHLNKIFEPGFTTRPGSAGLGLTVSKKIVEQHGGRLEVESRSGQGTAFTLVFQAMGLAR
jgi:signal transduction histidine kinase